MRKRQFTAPPHNQKWQVISFMQDGRQTPTRFHLMQMVELAQCQVELGHMTHGIQFQTAFQGQDTLSVVGKSAQVQA